MCEVLGELSFELAACAGSWYWQGCLLWQLHLRLHHCRWHWRWLHLPGTIFCGEHDVATLHSFFVCVLLFALIARMAYMTHMMLDVVELLCLLIKSIHSIYTSISFGSEHASLLIMLNCRQLHRKEPEFPAQPC
jgi:hypothetical protein